MGLEETIDKAATPVPAIQIAPETKTSILVGPYDLQINSSMQRVDVSKERIKKMFDKVELSVSSYDTAWVAMVPSSNSSHAPLFPGCVKWLLDNQHPDGSWSLPSRSPLLTKDALSSTLACILALKRWDIGEGHVKKGLHFIKSNFASVYDERQYSPIGFDILFSGMVEYARDMDLVLPLTPKDLDAVFPKRDLELERCHQSNSKGSKAYLAYLSEGLGKLNNWKSIMAYQRKNGSLFNSPSTTAAALTHLEDANCLDYLNTLLENFGDGDQKSTRRNTQWLQKDEEIVLDLTTCALAFRLLRTHGYDVSSDLLIQFVEKDEYLDSLKGQCRDTTSGVLELFKASQLVIHPYEAALEEQNSWSREFLQCKLRNGEIQDSNITKEVIHALNFPFHASLDRMLIRLMFSGASCSNISNEDFRNLGVQDFNRCQLLQQHELKQLESWETECRLDTLKFGRRKVVSTHFAASATIFSPELSEARISWVKLAVLAYLIDDFFDGGSSNEEQENLIHLFDKWDIDENTIFCSEAVEILFWALRGIICDTADLAMKVQGRCVKDHIIEIWMDVLKAMRVEAEWWRDKIVPTIDEYISTTIVSVALGPFILPAMYLVGPKLSEEVVQSSEYQELFKLLCICSRLLNDVQSDERETEEGKWNAVVLQMIHGGGKITKEDSIKALKDCINENRKKLLRMILQSEGSVVPRPCKDLIWDMSQIFHLFFHRVDGFTSATEMTNSISEVLYKPIDLKTILDKLLDLSVTTLEKNVLEATSLHERDCQ
ncbi:Terpene synthase, metal-binding domain, partial [Dillenia turbinata]